ncbi:MAG TPA: hypothetical protein VGS96_03825 [Thermoanaerobaculia bacterium]|jgi:hypothetical protein|nr:hypothetical protein [Thermoanaerobaculia bacterium]
MRKKLSLLVIMLLATPLLMAQAAVQTNRPAVRMPARRARTVPLLAIFMVAYDGVQKGTTTSNTRLVSAMQKVLNETPGAADAFAALHNRYVALTPQQRAALVGPELANATADTQLSPELIHRTFLSAMRRVALPSEAPIVWLTDAQVAAARRRASGTEKPSSVEALDPSHEPPGVKNIKTGTAKEVEFFGPQGVLTQTLPKITIPPPVYYSMRYKGFFCSDEGSDWGSSSEPYMIFNMVQGGKVWTQLAGPFGNTDTGDKVYKDISLLDKSTFLNPLQLQVIVMENDNWDPKQLVSVIQSGVSIYCEYETGGDCPKGTVDILGDILDWFFGLWENDDDLVGDVHGETIDIKTYFKSAYHQPSMDHGFLRTEAMLFDGTKTSDGRYWLFFELRKVSP